ncbi:PAS domain-containing protein [Geojedonia litorea]
MQSFRTILEHSTDMCCAFDSNTQITWLNKTALIQWGISKPPCHQFFYNTLVKKDRIRFKKSLEQILARPSKKGVFKGKHQFGASDPMELKWNFAWDPNNQSWFGFAVKEKSLELKVKGKPTEFKDAYSSLFINSEVPKWIYNEATLELLDANKAALKIYGYGKKEFLTLTLKNLFGKKDRNHLVNSLKSIKEGKRIDLGILEQFTKNGQSIKMQVSEQRIKISDTNCVLVSCLDRTEDILAQKVESLELETMKRTLKSNSDLEAVLGAYVKGLESIFPEVRVSILSIDDGKVWNLASHALPKAFMTGFNGEKIGPKEGSCGTAAYTKKRVIVEDISIDPLWEKYKDFALEFGLKACWSQPIIDSKKEVVATIANYYLKPKKPTRIELDLFNRSASFLAIILDNFGNRKKLESNLELYNYVNQATSDAIYDWDLVKDITVWGQSFERLFGHNPEGDIYNENKWKSLIHPKDYEKIKHGLNLFLCDPNQSRWEADYHFKKGDHTYVYVKEYGYAIRDSSGKVTRMIGVISDVTKSKLDSLNKQILSEFNSIFNNSESLNEALQNVVKNKSLQSYSSFGQFDVVEIWLVNRDKTELNLMVSQSDDQYIHATNNISILKNKEGLPGKVWEKEQPIIWKNISAKTNFVRYSSAAKLGLKNALGLPIIVNDECLGVLICMTKTQKENFANLKSVWKDITKPLGADIKRKQLEEEMDHIFSLAPVMIGLFDFEGNLKRINPAGTRLLEYTEQELKAQPIINLVHPDDLEKSIAVLSGIATNTISSNANHQVLNRYITKTGKIVWFDWSFTFSREQRLIYAVGNNVTETVNLQNLLDKATSLAQIGGWEVEMPSKKVYWSKITREIHEVDDDYVPSLEDGINFYREDIRPEIRKYVIKAIDNGTQWDYEYPIITGKGNERWIRSIGQAEFVNGKCRRLYGSFQNIHKSKLAEIELKKAFKERNEILERVGDGFFALDNDWKVIYWNGMAEKLLQVSKKEILNHNFFEVFPNAVDQNAIVNYRKSKETGKPIHFEDYYAPTSRWFDVSVYPSKTGLSVYFKDVSVRKQTEQKIKESNERFEKVSQATNDAIWDWDIVNDKLYLGEGFKTLFGQKLIGVQPTLDLWKINIHKDDYDEAIKSLTDAVEDPSIQNWTHEYRYLNQVNQSYAHIVDRGVIIRDQQNKAVRMVGAMTDITHRVEYQEQLKALNQSLKLQAKELLASNADLEQFAYVASHDLQEPLRMITGFLTQLEQKYKNQLDDKAQKYIYFAVDGAQRMRQIILDLLEYSRAGRGEDELEPIDIKLLINEAIALNKKTILDKNAKIIVGKMPTLRLYKSPLLQVFQNLIGNALKYAKEQVPPEITITCTATNNEWQFAIKDNGIGIGKDYYDKIFVIFQRLHNKEDYQGTGIGLAIIKKIIDNLSGKIWVESEVNVGSTFYFTLPK